MTRKAALTGTQLNVRHRAQRRSRAAGQRRDQPAQPARHRLRQHPPRQRRDSVRRRQGRPSLRADRSRPGQARDARRRRASTTHPAPSASTTGSSSPCRIRSGAGVRFGIARPVGQLLNDLRRTAARNAGLGLLFIAIALVGMVPLSGRLTRNLTSLTDGVGRIAQGDYGARVPVKSQRRDRPARRRVQPDGGRRRAAPALRGRAGAHPPRARARPADPARHAAARRRCTSA